MNTVSQPDPTGPVSEGVLIERLRDLNQRHPDADVLPFKEAADTIDALLEACERMMLDLGASYEPGVSSVTKMQAAIRKARGGDRA